MKHFLPFPGLRESIQEALLNAKPSFTHSPLEDVTQLLCDGRHYPWVGIYLAVPASGPQTLLEAGADRSSPSSRGNRSRILLSLKRGSREIGLLDVETDRASGFTAAEIAFLEGIADMLATYLAGRGRYLVRRARQADQAKLKARHAVP